MADVKFFKGVYPRQKLFLSNGSYIMLHDIGDQKGVFATDNQSVIDDLQRMIQRGRGGISEISGEEYTALKKNGRTSPKLGREEWSPTTGLTGGIIQTIPDRPSDMRGNLAPSQESAAADKAPEAQPAAPIEVPKPAARKRGRPPKSANTT